MDLLGVTDVVQNHEQPTSGQQQLKLGETVVGVHDAVRWHAETLQEAVDHDRGIHGRTLGEPLQVNKKNTVRKLRPTRVSPVHGERGFSHTANTVDHHNTRLRCQNVQCGELVLVPHEQRHVERELLWRRDTRRADGRFGVRDAVFLEPVVELAQVVRRNIVLFRPEGLVHAQIELRGLVGPQQAVQRIQPSFQQCRVGEVVRIQVVQRVQDRVVLAEHEELAAEQVVSRHLAVQQGIAAPRPGAIGFQVLQRHLVAPDDECRTNRVERPLMISTASEFTGAAHVVAELEVVDGFAVDVQPISTAGHR